MSTEMEKVTKTITQVLEECSVEVIKEMPGIQKAIILAKGMQALRAALTIPLCEQLFMPLQGTRIGFRTDKDKDGGYPVQVVRDCMIEAMMAGANPVGNEVNIIAGNAYLTKEHFVRKVPTIDGLTDLELDPGVPQMKDGGALVPYTARWTYRGKPMSLVRDIVKIITKNTDGTTSETTTDRRIPVKINNGQGADAILGKAKRKILAHVYDRIMGTSHSDYEVDVIDTTGETVNEKPVTGDKMNDLVNKHKTTAKSAPNGKADTTPVDPPVDQQQAREPGSDG